MKKMIALITALAALSCTFTACAGSSGSSSDTSASASASAESSSEENSIADTTAESSEASTGKKQQTSTEPDNDYGDVFEVEDAEYMDALEDFIGCMNDQDYVKLAEFMFPVRLIEYASNASGVTLEDLGKQFEASMNSQESKDHLPLTIKKVVEAGIDEQEEAAQDIKDTYNDLFSNIDNGSDESVADLKDYLNSISDVHMISVELEAADGESETEEFVAYQIADEGWKFDITMLTYVKKSKKSAANNSASSLYKAINSSLTDMDASGEDVSGVFIISSDGSKNYKVPAGFAADKLIKFAENYFNKIGDYDYFAVCAEGSCEYLVCQKHGDKNVGTYPANSAYSNEGVYTPDREKTYTELYDECVRVLD